MLSWALLAAAFIALPIVLRLFASDEPRPDDPPERTDDDRDPGPAAVPVAA